MRLVAFTQIAYDLGFQYSQHFNRVFKKSVGYTPVEYRRMVGWRSLFHTIMQIIPYKTVSLNSVIPQLSVARNPLYPNPIVYKFVPNIYQLPTRPLPSPYPLLISSSYFSALWKGGGKAKICTRWFRNTDKVKWWQAGAGARGRRRFFRLFATAFSFMD